jgi:hypothetical protein
MDAIKSFTHLTIGLKALDMVEGEISGLVFKGIIWISKDNNDTLSHDTRPLKNILNIKWGYACH